MVKPLISCSFVLDLHLKNFWSLISVESHLKNMYILTSDSAFITFQCLPLSNICIKSEHISSFLTDVSEELCIICKLLFMMKCSKKFIVVFYSIMIYIYNFIIYFDLIFQHIKEKYLPSPSLIKNKQGWWTLKRESKINVRKKDCLDSHINHWATKHSRWLQTFA